MAERGSEPTIEDDIAFIRRTVEEGRSYARGRSPDLMVWGLFMTVGYLGTYAYVLRRSPLTPEWLWPVCVVLPWIYSLRHIFLRRFAGTSARARAPMAQALSMLWLGCGISIAVLAVTANWTIPTHAPWFDSAVAAILAIAFFAGATLCNLGWMRAVAVGWWIAVPVMFALRNSILVLPAGAAFMFLLLAGPGAILLSGARRP
jgi:hypothetical protein